MSEYSEAVTVRDIWIDREAARLVKAGYSPWRAVEVAAQHYEDNHKEAKP